MVSAASFKGTQHYEVLNDKNYLTHESGYSVRVETYVYMWTVVTLHLMKTHPVQYISHRNITMLIGLVQSGCYHHISEMHLMFSP
jgi:hypothetical protein